MLDFRLYSFLILSRTLNYTKAAKELCITQPAVSQHIKNLETTYHQKLFMQDGKQLTLTKPGQFLYQCVERLAFDEKQMIKTLLNFDKQEAICFGATLTIGEFAIPTLLQEYHKRYPDTQITMIVENTSILLDMLRKGELQFAFVEGYFKKSEVTFRPFMKQRYIAVKSKEYQLKKPISTLEDLLEETIILREKGSGTREILDHALQAKDLTLSDFSNYMEIGNINVIKQLVMQHSGITFLYETAVQQELLNGTLEEIVMEDFPLERDFHFITTKDTIFLEQYLDVLQAFHDIHNTI